MENVSFLDQSLAAWIEPKIELILFKMKLMREIKMSKIPEVSEHTDSVTCSSQAFKVKMTAIVI